MTWAVEPADTPRPSCGAERQAIEHAIGDGHARLVEVARRLLRDEDEAQEVVQDACVLALRGSAGFAQRARASTWLHRIVVNAALLRLRARRRRAASLALDVERSPAPRCAASAEEVVARAQLREVVRRAVAALPERYRSVLVLRDLRERGTAEAAGALGLTTNAAKIRLHRARQALRAALTRHDLVEVEA
jgi:RNA polymerase sigma-70 factor (ECF subfamily)